MNLAFEGFGIEERIDVESSQWFTPPAIAWRMACWLGSPAEWSILEPSAGSGNLVKAALDRFAMHVDAFELDRHYADVLRERFEAAKVEVSEESYLDAPAPDRRYDAAIMNPPFEGGLDGEFLSKAMGECDRVIALVRLAALAGQGRYERVWSRVASGEWRLVGLAIFAARPVFVAGRAIGDRENGGSAKADFCVVKLSRLPGEPETKVEWW